VPRLTWVIFTNKQWSMTRQKSNGQHLKETTQFLKHTDDVYCFNFVSKADFANITFSVEMNYR